MAVAPDLRLGAGAADERIVGRRRAVGRDADDLAEMVAEVLRLVARAEVVAEREEQVAVRALARCGSRNDCRTRAGRPGGR